VLSKTGGNLEPKTKISEYDKLEKVKEMRKSKVDDSNGRPN